MDRRKKEILGLLADQEYHIKIYKAGSYRFHEGFQFYTHQHEEYEINYVNSGYCIVELEKGFVSLKQGDCVVIRPGTAHSFIVDAQSVCSITQVEFAVKGLNKAADLPAFLQGGHPCFKISKGEEVGRILESICRCNYYRKTEGIYELVMELSFVQLYTLLTDYEQQLDALETDSNDKIARMIRFIEENYDEQINLEALAEKYQISCRYLRKELKLRLGVSGSNYIMMLRINKAKKLLHDRRYSITEIAGSAGFNSSQYFSRVFSRFAGMSPKAFRYRCRDEKGDRHYE